MKKSVILSMIGLTSSPCLADGSISTNKHFSAEVVNIRRAATGKTLVTVVFTASAEVDSVSLYGNTQDCRSSATLIDADGNEYGTLRCMSLASGGGSTFQNFSGTGFKMDKEQKSSFVYEFSTPKSNNISSLININMIVPIYYDYCPLNHINGFGNPALFCTSNTTTLSFYNLSTK